MAFNTYRVFGPDMLVLNIDQHNENIYSNRHFLIKPLFTAHKDFKTGFLYKKLNLLFFTIFHYKTAY